RGAKPLLGRRLPLPLAEGKGDTGDRVAVSQHSHNDHFTALRPSRLGMALGIVLLVMVAEFIGGILSNSLALLSDAGHMLVDALALGLALFAIRVARRPATPTRTFGYYRVEILAALANGVTLLLLSAYIFYEAYQRFLAPPDVLAPLMLAVAVVGLLANLGGMLLLKGARYGSLNIRAAFWHVVGDTISSAGVIIAAIIIAVTGWRVADPLIAVVIGCIILVGAVRLVRESVDILLEAAPRHVEMDKLVEAIKGVPGVDGVHDIHLWTITSAVHALSAHLLIQDQMVSRSGEILEMVNHSLARDFNINHTTLQLECQSRESCPGGIMCDVGRWGEGVEQQHNGG
ncbi:MAG: cation diffusion facilitator family transporter, partial [Chloroflexota bacterium]